MNGQLVARCLKIHTYQEAVIYLHEICDVCISEGFQTQARVLVSAGELSIIATLQIVSSNLLAENEVGFSTHAEKLLKITDGDMVSLSHPPPLTSMHDIRGKIYQKRLSKPVLKNIMTDIVSGYLSDIQISAFVTACAGYHLDEAEILALTEAMVEVGDRLSWQQPLIVDKHCVGGVPGNRTSLIVVPIVAAFGLLMPKTSSYAITSPAGTADTMSVFAQVELDLHGMRCVVEKENACIIWGGGVNLSPADDILIQVERALNLDSEGQLIASVISKKVAAGSTHAIIDIPIGETAKIRSQASAQLIRDYLVKIGTSLGLTVSCIFSDGRQPVGYGIGPALEARDVMAVLANDPKAPQDLRKHALDLAGLVLEFSDRVAVGTGRTLAEKMLTSGQALKKFVAICDAQGGMRDIPNSAFQYTVVTQQKGIIAEIDNRYLANIAKLAGAPQEKAAGIDLHVKLGDLVTAEQPLFTIHAQTRGQLNYAKKLIEVISRVVKVEE